MPRNMAGPRYRTGIYAMVNFDFDSLSISCLGEVSLYTRVLGTLADFDESEN